MKARYCYWSLATGGYGPMMENCVRSAGDAGVFKEFHILTDRPLAGCECYDAFQCDKSDGLFKLHYLKVGMSRLSFDYFVWLDADTVFMRNPVDLLGMLGKSPIHVPLEVNLAPLTEDKTWNGASVFGFRDQLRSQGIANEPYLSGSALWTVHHDAIDAVYDLALGFWHKAKEAGLILDVSAALGFAMQILCADPEAHAAARHTRLWATDYEGRFKDSHVDGKPWSWRHPLGTETCEVQPAIVHLRHRNPNKPHGATGDGSATGK